MGAHRKEREKGLEMEFANFKERVAYFNARARKAKADGYQIERGCVYTIPDNFYKDFPKLVCSVYDYPLN